MFFAFVLLIPTLPVYLETFGGGVRLAGLAAAVLSLAAVISRPFTGWALDTYGRKAIAGIFVDRAGRRGYDLVVIAGGLLFAAALLFLSRISAPLHLAAAGIFYGFGFGSLQSVMLALCLSRAPRDKKGAANAAYWTAFDLGIFCGSIACGLLAGAFGYSAMFRMMALPAVLAVALYFAWKG